MTSISCKSQPPVTVPHVDLEKYAGLWYEIAIYPNRFERGCSNTTAEYQLSEKGYVTVTNRCTREGNKRTEIHGKAYIVPGSGNAKLKVQFFWPFRGDYWIIDLGENYHYAIVSNKKRTYLWILCREKTMDQQLYDSLVDKLKQRGFDTSKIVKTKHGA